MVVLTEEPDEVDVYVTLSEEEFVGLERAVAAALQAKANGKAPKPSGRRNQLPAEQLAQYTNILDASYEDGDWSAVHNLATLLLGECGVDWIPQIKARLAVALAYASESQALVLAQESFQNNPEEPDAYFAIAVFLYKQKKPVLASRWLQVALKAGLEPSFAYMQLTENLALLNTAMQTINAKVLPFLLNGADLLEEFKDSLTDDASLDDPQLEESLAKIREDPTCLQHEKEHVPNFSGLVTAIWSQPLVFRHRVNPDQLESHRTAAGDFAAFDQACFNQLAAHLAPVDVVRLSRACVWTHEHLMQPSVAKASYLGTTRAIIPDHGEDDDQWSRFFICLGAIQWAQKQLDAGAGSLDKASSEFTAGSKKDLREFYRMARVSPEEFDVEFPIATYMAYIGTLISTDRTKNTALYIGAHAALHTPLLVLQYSTNTILDRAATPLLKSALLRVGLAMGHLFGPLFKNLDFSTDLGLYPVLRGADALSELQPCALHLPTDAHLAERAAKEAAKQEVEENGEQEELEDEDEETNALKYLSGIYHLQLFYNSFSWFSIPETAVLKLEFDEETNNLKGQGLSTAGPVVLDIADEAIVDLSGSPMRSTLTIQHHGQDIVFQMQILPDDLCMSGRFIIGEEEDGEKQVQNGFFVMIKDARGYSDQLWTELQQVIVDRTKDRSENVPSAGPWLVKYVEDDGEVNQVWSQLCAITTDMTRLYHGRMTFAEILSVLQSLPTEGISDEDLAHAMTLFPQIPGETERKFKLRVACIVAHEQILIQSRLYFFSFLSKPTIAAAVKALSAGERDDFFNIFVDWFTELFWIHPIETLSRPSQMLAFMTNAARFLEDQANMAGAMPDLEDARGEPAEDAEDLWGAKSKKKSKKNKRRASSGVSTGTIIAVSAVAAAVVGIGAFFIGRLLTSAPSKKSN